MAKIYALPKGFEPPEFNPNLDSQGWLKQDEKFMARVVAEMKRLHPRDKNAGRILRFPHADGYAVYVVLQSRPFSLCHVPIGDAWRLPSYAERGITAQEIKRQDAWDRIWTKAS